MPKTKKQPELSARERQIMQRLADGLTYSEIAFALGIGYETVKTHMKRMRAKFGLRSKSHAAAFAARLRS